jgi:hypothetical protein
MEVFSMSAVHYTDSELCKRWKCSEMKLWRLRKIGALNSFKIAGQGKWLTSEEEVVRVESAPLKTYALHGVAAAKNGGA